MFRDRTQLAPVHLLAQGGHPLRLLAALHAAVIRLGGEIRGNATLREIKGSQGNFRLTAGCDVIEAPRIVIAAGLDVPLRPQRGQILVTERPPGSVRGAVGNDRPYRDCVKVRRRLTFSAPNEYLQANAKRYGVAFEISNYVMMYNPAVIKGTVPVTFDELIEVAKVSTGGGNFGYAYRATMAERNGFWRDLCNYVFGFGGRWGNGTNLTLNSPKVVEGVAAYTRMYESGANPKGADAATYRRMFWENKVGIEVANGGVAGIFNQQAPNLAFMAAPSPFPTRAQGLILAPLTVKANTKNKDAAFAFVKWALQADNQKDLQDLLGGSSVAIPVPRPADDLAKKPWLKVLDEQTPNAVPQLVAGFEVRTPELHQIIIEQELKVLQGGMTAGGVKG